MKTFLDHDFLLSTKTAQTLYHNHAAAMPIIDYHCHVSPKEIYEDKKFENLFEVWLSGDHYKWRIMRSNGVDERFITGDAPVREKFQAFAEALPKAIGNPMYHWCHLELKTYFGYTGVLNGDTAEEVWQLTKQKLSQPDMGVRGIIKQSGVALIGTTDDPIDSLEWHQKIQQDPTFDTLVVPSFRPDKAINIDKAGWQEYLDQLADAAEMPIRSVEDVKTALQKRIDHFAACGCRASDHGLDYIVYRPADDEQVESIFRAALAGEPLSIEEVEIYKTALLVFCAEQYAKHGWVMQLHYNCLRNPNTVMFERLGPDTGYDCISPRESAVALTGLLDRLYQANTLPKTVLYSLDPGDNTVIDTILGAFQGTEIPGKIQHGSAWWFNDNKQGMRDQLISLANLGLLGNFIGMLTDSRSFLSYTRHEYFRRILCDLIGDWVENGEFPNDEKTLGSLVEGICYHNAKNYFGLEE